MAPSYLLIELDLPDITSKFKAANKDGDNFIIHVTKGQQLYNPNVPMPMTTKDFTWTISVESVENLPHTVECFMHRQPVKGMCVYASPGTKVQLCVKIWEVVQAEKSD